VPGSWQRPGADGTVREDPPGVTHPPPCTRGARPVSIDPTPRMLTATAPMAPRTDATTRHLGLGRTTIGSDQDQTTLRRALGSPARQQRRRSKTAAANAPTAYQPRAVSAPRGVSPARCQPRAVPTPTKIKRHFAGPISPNPETTGRPSRQPRYQPHGQTAPRYDTPQGQQQRPVSAPSRSPTKIKRPFVGLYLLTPRLHRGIEIASSKGRLILVGPAGHAPKAALAKSGTSGDQVDYVIMGHVIQAGARQITARPAAVKGGIPLSVPALTVNKVCLSGLDAIALADELLGYSRSM
jgi:Thiolase, N-terminal domain